MTNRLDRNFNSFTSNRRIGAWHRYKPNKRRKKQRQKRDW